ncbi:hypothetical protein NDU88_001844 [Pleurodeles waltl]|uniref:Uncharacterized protein n=1 Tax=Pleurodeles waltl TaxID=8319 RepID=A0AAV7Q556_PLEWA|nr:hypothetical protein NDU88_001844 [Pleurodeles waltl]
MRGPVQFFSTGEGRPSPAGRCSRPRPRRVLRPPPEGAQGESPCRPTAGGVPRQATRGLGLPQLSTRDLQSQVMGGRSWRARAPDPGASAPDDQSSGGRGPARRRCTARAAQAGRPGRYPPTAARSGDAALKSRAPGRWLPAPLRCSTSVTAPAS